MCDGRKKASSGIWLIGFLCLVFPLKAQPFDVAFYGLEIKLHEKNQRIAGTSRIDFQAVQPMQGMELSLHPDLEVVRASFQRKTLRFRRQGDKVMLEFPRVLKPGNSGRVFVLFAGKPPQARNLGESGFTWEGVPDDPRSRVYVQQGGEPMVWWPQHSHPGDLADSMQFSLILPEDKGVITNGDFIRTENLAGPFRRWNFAIDHPSHPEALTFYAGDFSRSTEVYKNKTDYHEITVISEGQNDQNIRSRALQIKQIMGCLENYFGEYPFWDEGYQLVEKAYENISGPTSWPIPEVDPGLIYEVALSWFQRVIKSEEANPWFAQALATYAQALYLEYTLDRQKAWEFLQLRRDIPNYRGAWLLNTLRHQAQNERAWLAFLSGIQGAFNQRKVRERDIWSYVDRELNGRFAPIMKEYLQHNGLPTFVFRKTDRGKKTQLYYKWDAAEPDFNLEVEVEIDGRKSRLPVNTEWQELNLKGLEVPHLRVLPQHALFEVKQISGTK